MSTYLQIFVGGQDSFCAPHTPAAEHCKTQNAWLLSSPGLPMLAVQPALPLPEANTQSTDLKTHVCVACRCFDVLYVVDPYRAWYDGGDVQLMHKRYTSRLRQYTEQYKHVVMIGDSMGASAALLFSPLATKVMSFCPQVRWGHQCSF